MEVHRQTCQVCGSKDVRNILVREPGRAQMVFVRCSNCHSLVARYRLSDYYHHGKGIESYLRSVGGGFGDSGRRELHQFGELKEEAEEGYRRALESLEEEGKEI